MSGTTTLDHHERLLYSLTLALLGAIVAGGLVADGVSPVLSGLWRIQLHPARLLNDFSLVGGEGASLLNAAIVALIGVAMVRATGVRLSGPTISAIFTMFGFGLFGKTPLNIIPILAGVAIAARIARTTYSEYILIALFGTALAPLVSLVAAELGLAPALGIPAAAVAGLVAGTILPAVARAMLRLHQGYSLYNIGLTTGVIALFAAALIFGGRAQLDGGSVWNDSPSLLLVLVTPAASAALLVTGLAMGPADSLREFAAILKLTGRLPSDFMSMRSVGGSLVNMGAMGLLAWGYAFAVGAPLNGPVLGGLFTIIGFAAFGKHPANVWPIVAGVVIAALAFGLDLAAPGVILAALFGTTLAPLVGDFGVALGLVAGALHLSIVMRSGAWHAGIGLYNNGFAGGLTATLLVALIEWVRSVRPAGRLRRDEARERERS